MMFEEEIYFKENHLQVTIFLLKSSSRTDRCAVEFKFLVPLSVSLLLSLQLFLGPNNSPMIWLDLLADNPN